MLIGQLALRQVPEPVRIADIVSRQEAEKLAQV